MLSSPASSPPLASLVPLAYSRLQRSRKSPPKAKPSPAKKRCVAAPIKSGMSIVQVTLSTTGLPLWVASIPADMSRDIGKMK